MEDPTRIGPKAASLERMRDAGLPVPPAFHITAAAYREHLRAHGLDAYVASRVLELADRTPDPVATPTPEGALAEIRDAIRSEPLEPEIESDIRSRLHALGGGPVAVRSSGTAEDLRGHSFAGQHGTYFAADAEGVLARVKDCWASLWTDHAFTYRDRRGFGHLDVGMAVIVQRLVDADAAGVAFTADPVTGVDRIVIEAVWGIGESLVSGRVPPDRWILDRDDLHLLQTTVASKPTRIGVGPDGLVESLAVEPGRIAEPSLGEPAVRRVAELALAAEAVFDEPVDVEWALEGDDVWLLQARPVTTLDTFGARPFVWSNVNVGEVLPDVLTPMTWSILKGFVEEMLVGMFGHLGVTIAEVEVTRLIAGRAYFNATVLGAAFRTLPGTREVSLDEVLGGMQSAVDVPREFFEYDLPNVHGGLWKTARALPGLLAYVLRHAPKRAPLFCANARTASEAAYALLDPNADEEAIAELVQSLVRELIFMADGLGFAGIAMSHWATFTNITERWLGDSDLRMARGLLAARGGVVSAEAGLAMADLAVAAMDEGLTEVAVADGPWIDVRCRLEHEGPSGARFLQAWDAFMNEHGHHTRGELELGNARWRERPDYVLDIVRGYLSAGRPSSLLADRDGSVSRRDALLAQCRENLRNPFKRFLFERFLRLAVDGCAVRELVKSEGVRRIAVVRWLLLELGRRMSDRLILAEPEDVFFLTWSEWNDVRRGVADFDVRGAVRDRRAEHARNETTAPPPVVIGEWDSRTGRTPEAPSDTTELAGIGASPGVVRGPARVVTSVTEHVRVLPGEILVAPFTDPGWTPYFIPAVGIVMDMGGVLSHGSIIAREYGLPAVVNVASATQLIQTGQTIEVDGDRGVVRILE